MPARERVGSPRPPGYCRVCLARRGYRGAARGGFAPPTGPGGPRRELRQAGRSRHRPDRPAADGPVLGYRHATLGPHLQRPETAPPACGRPSSPQARRQGSGPPVSRDLPKPTSRPPVRSSKAPPRLSGTRARQRRPGPGLAQHPTGPTPPRPPTPAAACVTAPTRRAGLTSPLRPLPPGSWSATTAPATAPRRPRVSRPPTTWTTWPGRPTYHRILFTPAVTRLPPSPPSPLQTPATDQPSTKATPAPRNLVLIHSGAHPPPRPHPQPTPPHRRRTSPRRADHPDDFAILEDREVLTRLDHHLLFEPSPDVREPPLLIINVRVAQKRDRSPHDSSLASGLSRH